jgi:hypothetical protein
MTATKAPIVLADSLATVKERVNTLQHEKKSRTEILIELKDLIFDTTLFSVKQRAVAIREVNKDFKLNVTMSELKRAIKTVNTAKPEKATPVDGLAGTATLDLGDQEATAANKAPEATPAPAAPVAEKPARQREVFTLKGDQPSTTTKSTTQEDTTMAPIKETLQAVSDRIATGAPQTHAEKVEALNILLAGSGATTEEARQELIKGFIAANPSLAVTWNLMQAYPQGEHGVSGLLVAYLEIDPNNRALFEKYLGPIAGVERPAEPVAPIADPSVVAAAAQPAGAAKPEVAVAVEVAAPGLKERVMTTIRGNRETGFSSGVVAAATAVVGGGLEMVFKGSATLGSAVGTGLGATGAYFLGDATEKMMDSETGRYLLAGAIGVVAGGLGSRVGRGVQDEYVNPSAEVVGALENVPGAPVAQPGGLVNNSESLLSAFGL